MGESTETAEIYRAGKGGYIGVSLITAFLLGIAAVIATRDLRGGVGVVCIVGATAWFAIAWLKAFRIELSPTTLRYHTLTHDRTVTISEITQITFTIEPFASASGPTVRLTLALRSDREPLVINARVFGRDTIQRVKQLAPSTSST
jgi:hypothetical protein